MGIPLEIWFNHGLGDCVPFAHILAVYAKFGYVPEIHCDDNKRFVWNAAAIPYRSIQGTQHHKFDYPSDFGRFDSSQQWSGNKIFYNLSQPPLPQILPSDQMWNEVCSTRIDATNLLSVELLQKAADRLRDLPRPVIAFHSNGTTWSSKKSIPDRVSSEVYGRLLRQTTGSVVLLDWDFRVPWLEHVRARHLKRDWGHLELPELAAILSQCDLLIGVDSGPYHFSRMFPDLPVLGVFRQIHPSQCGLPNPRSVNMVSTEFAVANACRRIYWNLVEYEGPEPTSEDISRLALQMLEENQFFPSKVERAKDVLFGSVVDKMGRFRPSTMITALKELKKRGNASPRIVETGCIRVIEDWSAGYSTYVFALYLSILGSGSLHVIDINQAHLRLAQSVVGGLGVDVSFNNASSERFLETFQDSIDLLYLDSLDVEDPAHAEHCLNEFKACEKCLHENSIVIIDDTPFKGTGIVGKGMRVVPYMLSRGWKVIDSGYQFVLVRHDYV